MKNGSSIIENQETAHYLDRPGRKIKMINQKIKIVEVDYIALLTTYVLEYPAISSGEYAHRDSLQFLLQDRYDQKQS